MPIEIGRWVKRIRSDGGGWKELGARTATASRRSVAPDSREGRLSARAIKILSKNERRGPGREVGRRRARERGSERANERESEEERHQRTERNLKGHPAIHLSMQPLTRRLFVRRDRTNPSGNCEFLFWFSPPIRSSNPHQLVNVRQK